MVNTRALHQAAALDDLLRAAGTTPLSYPCLAIVPPDDTALLDNVLRDLLAGCFDWLVLTSGNAVDAIATRLRTLGYVSPFPVPATCQIAAVGRATSRNIGASLGLTPSFVPTIEHGEALASELPIATGATILMPVSEIAGSEPADILRDRGAVVTRVMAYRTIVGTGGIDLLPLLQRGEVDAITFTSPSTVTGCFQRLTTAGCDDLSIQSALSNLVVVTIGPTTQRAAEARGLADAVMSPTPALRDLVATVHQTLAIRQLANA